jgi:hypothetical protein
MKESSERDQGIQQAIQIIAKGHFYILLVKLEK